MFLTENYQMQDIHLSVRLMAKLSGGLRSCPRVDLITTQPDILIPLTKTTERY
jgi:hypothetical protein